MMQNSLVIGCENELWKDYTDSGDGGQGETAEERGRWGRVSET